ncbi:formate/nitrite transporter family protein [Modestobacter sp. I12A-02628]|uniref:Formate/nitrite transporter family protein n=1 Tax=Goekera deserti TaxID=2497753 RepID=A0A7K3WCM2_9ACTN|nr:formate/nitrite transporter family protein [Goekera deserti]MPQ98565.1 formate/nitrite transporter family protein [Goekera deserti]NDI49065.1 formate/nitrite transporter family protein [Goekera deserti]NEL54144.1 formate/nitrite transporter family protein [Goekera deserti]
MVDQARVELGSTDAPAEDEVQEAFELIVSEGAQRLHRTWREVLATGLAGGVEVATGVLALLAVYTETQSHLLAGLAFSIGFIALLLARSELFTEGFLVPVTAVVAGRAAPGQLARLWSGTLVGNLVGGWLMMWVVVHAFPQYRATAVESAVHFVDAPFDVTSACLAFLAGAALTLMTRMQHGTTSDPAKIVAAVAGAFLLAGLQMFHSILDSLIVFAALQSGAPFGYGAWLGWFWWTALLNMAGGLLVVTLLRLVRSKDLIQHERAEAGAGR